MNPYTQNLTNKLYTQKPETSNPRVLESIYLGLKAPIMNPQCPRYGTRLDLWAVKKVSISAEPHVLVRDLEAIFPSSFGVS